MKIMGGNLFWGYLKLILAFEDNRLVNVVVREDVK